VIVPETTWVATAAPIAYVGATPVFADIDRDTWCMDAVSLARCINARTKAIVTVDLYGSIPDMGAIGELAKGIPIIEDAAQAIGASWHGAPAGTLGDIGVFSFHGTKTMTTGEGGMLVTNRSELFDRVSTMRDHGRTRVNHRLFTTDEIGFKYRMSGLQAAFGRAQLSRIDELLERKTRIFRWYEERLNDIPGIRLNFDRQGVTNTFWMVTVAVDPSYGLSTRDMMVYFDRQSIDTRPFLPPLSSLAAFAEYDTVNGASQRNPVSYDVAARSINLPSALVLNEAQVDRVCAHVRELLSSRKER
jgi:perosamine synthetase